VLAFGSAAGISQSGLTGLLVGLLVLGIGLSLGGPTGYAINPARDLAPRIAHAILPIPGKGPSDWGYSWIPVVGPIIGTFVLMFGVLAIVGNKYSAVTGLGGLYVGLLVFAIGLSLGGPTGYAINPARDLGPRIIHAILPIPGKGPSDWGYAWIPVIGPLIGAALGAWAFKAFYP